MTLDPRYGVVKTSSAFLDDPTAGGDTLSAGTWRMPIWCGAGSISSPWLLQQRWRSRRRLPGGARRGRADYEPGGKCDVQRLELVAIHKPDQLADRHAA
jgi:hypothetical protein